MADYLKTADVWTVLDLIVAEFQSDPTSVACFDRRLVERAIELNRAHQGDGPTTSPGGRSGLLVAARLAVDAIGQTRDDFGLKVELEQAYLALRAAIANAEESS